MTAKYNKLSLAPFDEEERLEFRKFRDDDVVLVHKYVCILALLELIILIPLAIYSVSTGFEVKSSLIKMFQQLCVTVVAMSVWLLGQRFKDYYTFLIGSSFVTSIAVCILGIALTFEEESEVGRTILIFKLMGYLMLFVLLLAPSISFMLLYVITWFVGITYITILQYEETAEIIGFAVILMILWGTFWYILQARELKRFYQQQDAEEKGIQAVNKEIEITNVLNLQQNAVIIFSPTEEDSNLPKIEFANIKSTELFKFDLKALDA